jgi:uncharacterized membrane protein
MDGGTLVFVILVACGLLVAGPVLALIALARIGRLADLQKRIEDLENWSLRVRSRLPGPERAEGAGRPTATTAAGPAGPPKPERPEEPAGPPWPVGPVAPPPVVAPGMEPPVPGEPLPTFLSRTSSSVSSPASSPGSSPLSPPGTPPLSPPRSSQASTIDWERWVGIRGAAVLGAVALGLAGLLFFKYSIEHGLVTPLMRVVSGTLVGLASLVGSEWLRTRRYRAAAEGISGAGVVILYAAFWAAHVLYGLIGMTTSFILMILVTIACCLLSLRHGSPLVVVLGLVGGFATPLLLSSGADRPFGLFGYVLLLDLGLLFIGRRRRWPWLGLLSLLGTVLMQGLWIGARMGPDRLFLGLAILGVFYALFAVSGRFSGPRAGEDPVWLRGQAAALFFPFVFALYFAGRVELGGRLYPIALLLALLCAGACWMSRGQGAHPLGVGAAGGSLAVCGVWLLQHPLTPALAWETVGVAVGLAVIFHIFVEIDPEPRGPEGPAFAAIVAVGGFHVLLLLAAYASAQTPWPWLAGWAATTALLYRHAGFPGRAALQPAAAIGLGLGLTILIHARVPQPGFPGPNTCLALLVVSAIVLHCVALLRRQAPVRRPADHAAAALCVLLLVAAAPATTSSDFAAAPALGTMLILGILALLAATRLGAGAWSAAATGATWFAHGLWTFARPGLRHDQSEILVALAIQGAAVVVFTAWPLLTARRFVTARPAWRAAALSGPAWFPLLRHLFTWRFGGSFIGVVPIALGALALGAADRVRRAGPREDPIRLSALAWFAAVALCFVAVAIPLQLDREWITIGWALQGLCVLMLWKRLDHAGLKWFAVLLLGAATVRLVANPALLGYYPRSSMRVVNWLLYTYLVPAAALLWSAAILRPIEAGRARPAESGLYTTGRPVCAAGAGVAAIAVVFVWINLAIADWFATGARLTLSFGDQPAQRLTVSLAWALYALILLGCGMARSALGLRWISLAFLLVTIGKVFLYDLGALKDLYRVASLVGLAVSLILVSLAYQRFVFRESRLEKS